MSVTNQQDYFEQLSKLLPPLPTSEIELDWRAYFEEFCAAHGGEPVEFEGRLIFRDGWAYSKSDHKGPEWAPGTEQERTRIALAYWTMRRAILETERQALSASVEEMRLLQLHRSAPLMVRAIKYDDDGVLVGMETKPLDTAALADRLTELEREIAECDTMLNQGTCL
jgi:hypothetical protein